MQEERNELKKKLLGKKETTRRVGNSQPVYIAKTCSEENAKGMTEQPFAKGIMGVTHGLNHLSGSLEYRRNHSN